MKIGISITSAYQVDDVRAGAEQMIARAKAANRAGLDSLFVGDHHVVPTPYYQNTPILGRLLAEWDQRPAGALMLLPLWHPVLAAEQLATLACISNGRFILQCGLGHGERVFKAMGANSKHRPSAFEQSLACLRDLWQGKTVSLDGRWQFEEARISPLPPEPIAIWIGASAPAAIDRAAKLGDAWLANPSMTIAEAGQAMSCYQEACARHSRELPSTIAIRRDIYVAESSSDARQVKELITRKGYRGFDPEALIIGEAQEVADQFSAFEQLGYTDIIVRNLHTSADKAVQSTERLASVKALIES